MRKLLLAVALVLATLVFTGAPAEAKGPYISLFGGGVLPFDSRIEFIDDPTEDVDLEFDSGFGGGVSTGYWFNDQGLSFLGLALDFSGHKVGADGLDYRDEAMTDIGVESDLIAGAGMLNILFRLPIGPVRPYVGAGAGWLWAEMDDGYMVNGAVRTPFKGDDDDAFAWQAIGGIDIRVTPISPRLSVFAEYRYLRSDLTFSGGDMGIEADLDYEASEIFGGFTWHFQE